MSSPPTKVVAKSPPHTTKFLSTSDTDYHNEGQIPAMSGHMASLPKLYWWLSYKVTKFLQERGCN